MHSSKHSGKLMTIYVGYDPDLEADFNQCVASIVRTASRPVRICKLDQKQLRRKKDGYRRIQYRDRRRDQWWDVDGAGKKTVCSTQFSITRFLAPWANRYRGHVLYCDSDFIFEDDIYKLLDGYQNMPYSPIACVQHGIFAHPPTKMGGVSNEAHPRKCWSSLMIFDAEFWEARLTPEVVNTMSGFDLHNFAWVPEDVKIGALSERWNWLEGISPTTAIRDDYTEIGAIHYTLGTGRYGEET